MSPDPLASPPQAAATAAALAPAPADPARPQPEIPYSRPYLTQEDEAAVVQALRAGQLVMGRRVAAFESGLAALCGRRHAVAVSSGTAALQAGLRALGVGPDWDVFVPAYTWVATYNVPHLLGANVRLVDVDPRTFCMDAADLDAALRDSGAPHRLVVPVHLFGYRCGGDFLDGLLAEHGAAVLGDGCCALGGTDRGKTCGAWTPVECLSFHPRKVITTGEGGAILLDDDALAARLRRLRDHGAHRSAEQRLQTGLGGPMVPDFPEPGYNLRMTELQGALGCAQLGHLPHILAERRRIAALYDTLLADGPEWLMPPPGADDPGRVLTCYVTQLWGQRRPPALDELHALGGWRDRTLAAMAEAGVAARPPMVDLLQPYIDPGRRGDFAGTRTSSRLAIGLPLFPGLTDADAERVVATLRRAGEASRPR